MVRIYFRLWFLFHPHTANVGSLPPLIESLKNGWASALQSSATVVRASHWPSRISLWSTMYQSALFAGVSSQLYSFFTSMSGDNNSYTRRNSPQGALTFMVLLSYAAMLFNSGAAITSFILVDSLSELPYTNATFQDEPYPRSSRVFEGPSFLLRRYGVGIKWDLALWHCKHISKRVCTLRSWNYAQGYFVISRAYGVLSCRSWRML